MTTTPVTAPPPPGIEIDNTIKSITFNAQLGKFVLFGDSITQRSFSLEEGRYSDGSDVFVLGSALSNLFTRRLDVVHRGFSGFCSEHARYIVDDLIEALPGIKLAVSRSSFFFFVKILTNKQKLLLSLHMVGTYLQVDMGQDRVSQQT